MGRYRAQCRRYIASDIGGGGYAAMAAMWAIGSYIKAVLFADVQKQAVQRLESGYPRSTINQWSAMVDEWDLDHSKPDPYLEPEHGKPFLSISSLFSLI
jgi:hypothetical protein